MRLHDGYGLHGDDSNIAHKMVVTAYAMEIIACVIAYSFNYMVVTLAAHIMRVRSAQLFDIMIDGTCARHKAD